MKSLKKLALAAVTVGLASAVAGAALPTTGLKVRLESDQVVVDGTNLVLEWTDQSGSGHTAYSKSAAVPTSYQRPLLQANQTPTGRAAIKFNYANRECLDITGTSDLDMTDDNPALGTLGGISWYVVYRTNSVSSGRRAIAAGYEYLYAGQTSPPQDYGLVWASTDGIVSGTAPDTIDYTNSFRSLARDASNVMIFAFLPKDTTNATDYYVGGGVWSNTDDKITTNLVKADGTLVTHNADGVTATPNGNAYVRIGGGGGSSSYYPTGTGNFFDGHIAAAVVYNRALTRPEQAEVEKYLRTKYLHIRPDMNYDKYVDQTDFDAFVLCVSGPAIPHADTADCRNADFDDDDDVDVDDFGVFQRCYAGSTQYAAADCE